VRNVLSKLSTNLQTSVKGEKGITDQNYQKSDSEQVWAVLYRRLFQINIPFFLYLEKILLFSRQLLPIIGVLSLLKFHSLKIELFLILTLIL